MTAQGIMKTASTSNRMKSTATMIKAHAETAARVADGLDAALVGGQLDLGVAMAADQP